MESSKIRNFCIIAHIDHGKSTLSDRFLELTETVPKNKMRPQFLDKLDIERERGITIKLQPVTMSFQGSSLNLIDTPGHMDFFLEVKRSLEAVEGAILLVDSVKGIQAQTLSHLELAQKLGVVIIPVINKIDLPGARVEEARQEIEKILPGLQIFEVSAKTGQGVMNLLKNLMAIVPAPQGDKNRPLKLVIFDSYFDPYSGVIHFVRVLDGVLSGRVGIFCPEMKPVKELLPGEIGYYITGQKDSFGQKKENYQPMVFSSLFPDASTNFDFLRGCLQKLQLNDPSLFFEPINSSALGRGFRCGFLGLLHMEIALERMKRELSLSPIITQPEVNLKINENGEIKEPWVRVEIITPPVQLNAVLSVLNTLRGEHKDLKNLGTRLEIIYETPLYDIINGFYDRLKSATSGFASASYYFAYFRESNLEKVEILINGEQIEPLGRFIPKDRLFREAKKLTQKLKELIPRQGFIVAIQASSAGKIIARETIKPFRKNVIEGLYGGDYSRKKKLLEKQRKGKKKMKQIGKIQLPNTLFIKALSL